MKVIKNIKTPKAKYNIRTTATTIYTSRGVGEYILTMQELFLCYKRNKTTHLRHEETCWVWVSLKSKAEWGEILLTSWEILHTSGVILGVVRNLGGRMLINEICGL